MMLHQSSISDEPAFVLSDWICGAAPDQPDQLTHLKLQKLAFYCYGGLLAFGLENSIGDMQFEAWKHGPVSPVIFGRYHGFRASPLPRTSTKPEIETRSETIMRHVLNVYGRLTGWQLREESHEARPWSSTFDGTPNKTIPKSDLIPFFRDKFAGPVVRFPERLFGSSSLILDRIPVPSFSSLEEMSIATTRILGEET
ncbi:MAG: DUF4065 domain-containing protein [Polyangiaceae bacterium]|nr:DUF4065 domain-containing protein [Polyangiaceae bacterium]